MPTARLLTICILLNDGTEQNKHFQNRLSSDFINTDKNAFQ